MWHDMLNGVLAAVQPVVDLFIFGAIPILQALKNIGFVPGWHGIDVFRFQPFRKVLICGEGSLLFFAAQHILHFLQETIVSAVQPLDVITKGEEHLALCVGRQVTNQAAEQICLHDAADLGHSIQ